MDVREFRDQRHPCHIDPSPIIDRDSFRPRPPIDQHHRQLTKPDLCRRREMPRSPSPTSSLIGPSRSNSVVRQQEKKPYERPSNGNAISSSNTQNNAAQQQGLLGGLKRSLSRWFSASPAPAEVDPTPRTSHSDERKMPTSTSIDSTKRQAPQMSPERAGTPSKKQRVVSPNRLDVQGRAVESFNVQEYGSSRLPTQRQDRQRVPNYARPFGTIESASSSTSMTRSRTMGGGYNDPPVSMLAASPARNATRPSTSASSGMRRSETMTLHVDRSKNTPASPSNGSFRSPLYGPGISRSSTLGNLAAPAGRMSSPFRSQPEAAEKVAYRQRAMKEGSTVPASPGRTGLRSQSRMDVELTNTRVGRTRSIAVHSGRAQLIYFPVLCSGRHENRLRLPLALNRLVVRCRR